MSYTRKQSAPRKHSAHFFRRSFSGADHTTDWFSSPDAKFRYSLMDRFECGGDYCEVETVTASDGTSVATVREDRSELTVSYSADGSDRSIKTEKIVAKNPDERCKQIQNFFRKEHLQDPLTLTVMCKRTSFDIKQALEEHGHRVDKAPSRGDTEMGEPTIEEISSRRNFHSS